MGAPSCVFLRLTQIDTQYQFEIGFSTVNRYLKLCLYDIGSLRIAQTLANLVLFGFLFFLLPVTCPFVVVNFVRQSVSSSKMVPVNKRNRSWLEPCKYLWNLHSNSIPNDIHLIYAVRPIEWERAYCVWLLFLVRLRCVGVRNSCPAFAIGKVIEAP